MNGDQTMMTLLTGVSAAATLALAFITAYYARLTHRIAKSSAESVGVMKDQYDQVTRPYITVRPLKQSHNPFINLVVENVGQTVARNVRLTLDMTLDKDSVKFAQSKAGARLASAYAFNNTIESFAPRTPLFFLLGSGSSLDGFDPDKECLKLKITAQYTYGVYRETKAAEVTVVDVNQYTNTILESDPVVQALKDIKDEIRKKQA